MIPSLTVFAGNSEQCFDATEKLVGKSNFCRAMHFGLDDVNRTGARIADAVFVVAAQIMQRNRHCDDRIENAFGDFFTITVQNRRTGHQMTDIAQQQQ